MNEVDALIIGASAAGLMCAIEAGKRGRKVVILDHANKAGKKILMSGGGRCNFTNENASPEQFISHNPHFCKSALSRYTQHDFIALVKKHNIPFHEKTLGQLFCDNKSKDILNMLLAETKTAGAEIFLNTVIEDIQKQSDESFQIKTSRGVYKTQSLVVATGGLSIPTMGATPFGYQLAEQFGIKVWPTRAGLVPFTLHIEDKEKFASLSGVSADAVVSNDRISFRENILFTHRGLSGPAILQISSYWQPGESVSVNLLPEINLSDELNKLQTVRSDAQVRTALADYLPKRLIMTFLPESLAERPLKQLVSRQVEDIAATFHKWIVRPNGTEGYRTAEVTLGGVDCNAISSKTMEANDVKGLYFIGEVLDVTGWLGGYNFQWAWSSGWAAGQVC